MKLYEGRKFQDRIDTHEDYRIALENLYRTVNLVHTHLISGPDKATLNKLLKDLEKEEEVIGVNLTNRQIAEITSKDIKND